MDRSAKRRVGGLILLLAAIAAPLWCLAARLPGYQPDPPVNWITLAVLSLSVERFVLHLQLRREAQAVWLSEVPQVLGLFLTTPLSFGVGRTLRRVMVPTLSP